MPSFPTDYPSILARLHQINPVAYSATRNHLDGAVTHLSPYLTHGVLSTREVGKVALRTATQAQAATLLRELAWRDFYQATWSSLGDAIFRDLRYPQPFATHQTMPLAVEQATTGIQVIDRAITELYQTGYLHNHARMWTAMLCCTIARTAWWSPSQWMYYHLLDGDIASNTLSWQWVAGSCRKEPYLANQETINTFSGDFQQGTYLDVPYEQLAQQIPQQLLERSTLSYTTSLTPTVPPTYTGEVLLYHPWSLNPTWYQQSSLPRVLLLEPDHFARFPISPQRLRFIQALADNIPHLVTVTASVQDLQRLSPTATFRYVAHPAVRHWTGVAEQPEPLFHTNLPVEKNWSFSTFWSKATCTLSYYASAKRN
jgi:deoxyribodipyrimidine photo-lyase